jgi:hypothetical protein
LCSGSPDLAQHAPAESFSGLLKQDRVNRRCFALRSEARADVFDYIERFHNPRMRRRVEGRRSSDATLTQVSIVPGYDPVFAKRLGPNSSARPTQPGSCWSIAKCRTGKVVTLSPIFLAPI